MAYLLSHINLIKQTVTTQSKGYLCATQHRGFHFSKILSGKDGLDNLRIQQALTIIGVSAIVQWPICGVPAAIGLTLLLVVIAIVWASPTARPLGVLLFWPMVINFFCHPYGLHGAGFLVLLPLAGLLLIPVWPSVIRSWQAIPQWILLSGLGLISWWFVSWLAGPRTDWGTVKFFISVGRLVIGIFAFSICMKAKRNTFLDVGVIGLTVGAFLFAVNFQKFPISSFGLGVWKSDLTVGAEAMTGPRALGLAVVIQLVFIIIQSRRHFFTLIGSTLLCAAPTMIASGSRQMLLAMPIALSGLLVQKHIRLRTVVALSPLAVIIGIIVIYGFTIKHKRYVILVDDNLSLSERAWRRDTWVSGIDTWRKSPLFGVGLGGFDKDNKHFGRGYPHNLGIEMLAETGLVGFVLGIGFLISCWATILYRQRAWIRKDFVRILPIWAYCFAIAMVSQDIPANIEVLYIPAAALGARMSYLSLNNG